MPMKFGEAKKGKRIRACAALVFAVFCVAACAGCSMFVNMKRMEKQARARARRSALPRELTLPMHLQPFQGDYPDKQGADTGFSLSIPPGGWYRNTGLVVPDAAVVFVHGDTDPFDIVVAVVPDQPALAPASAPGALSEQGVPDTGCTQSPAPGESLQALAVDYFKGWFEKALQPAPGGAWQSPRGAAQLYTAMRGYFPPKGASPGGAPPHNTAQVYAFPQPDGKTTLLIFCYPEIFEDRLKIYIDDIVAHFRIQ